MGGSEVKEAVNVVWERQDDWIEVKRSDGSGQRIRMCHVPLPRRGGLALLLYCPMCGVPRRHLYGWTLYSCSVNRSLWQCRTCAGLRYQSEGTYIPRPWRALGGYPRTPPWDPYVFTDYAGAANALGLDSDDAE
jgi:hypothetical protein